MPLLPGKENIGANISELTHHGSRPRSHSQIVAIALSEADRTKGRALGGSASDAAWRIAHRDAGGYTPPAAPFFERQEARATTQSPYGFAAGVGLGRHDKNDVSVAAGSYVLPSDVVAGLGDGNSLAGAHVFNQILASMPWGVTAPRSTGHRGPPPPPHDAYLVQSITGTHKDVTLARGGMGHNGGPGLDDEAPEEVPIVMADGEYTLSPEQVLRIGQFYSPQRDLNNHPSSHARIMRRGHRILDGFVKQTRGKTIRHLKELKGPVGSKDASRGHI